VEKTFPRLELGGRNVAGKEAREMTKKTLVVDDSASIRQLITIALEDAGISVVSAGNGKEALGKLNAEKFDLIITDLNMPEMDGIELIRDVRGIPEYRFAPIIMLTTEAQEEIKKQGKAAGATGWIVKPFSSEQLLSVVRKVL
jgi:two-component system, chemotaxis family, chemotaxis protein CheY